MALVRRGGKTYYYTSERVGGRVVTRYAGAGFAAELMARMDAVRRSRRETAAADRRAEHDETRTESARLRRWLAAADAAVAAVLRPAGWHRHRREWRKRRGAVVGDVVTITDARATWVPAEVSALAGKLAPADEAKAANGDKTALTAVDAYLANPAAALLWGDVGRHLLLTWVRRYANGDLLMEGAVLRVASDLRTRLAGPAPSAVDLLLAERVVLGWVFCLWCEWQHALIVGKDASIKMNEFHLRRVGMAQRNLNAACSTLSKVKRMKLPEVLALVNVAPADAAPAVTHHG